MAVISAGNRVRRDGDESGSAEGEDGQCKAVVASEDLEAGGRVGEDLGDLAMLPLDSLMPMMLSISARRRTVAGSRFAPVRLGML